MERFGAYSILGANKKKIVGTRPLHTSYTMLLHLVVHARTSTIILIKVLEEQYLLTLPKKADKGIILKVNNLMMSQADTFYTIQKLTTNTTKDTGGDFNIWSRFADLERHK